MTTQFPTMVYKCPGVHKCQGATYDYKAAHDEQQLKGLTDAGWSISLAKAISRATAVTGSGSAKPQAVKLAEPAPVDTSAIIRAWLSGKLNDNGVDHDEAMHEDELLFLICSLFAVEEVDGEGAGDEPNDNPDEAPPTREELEAKATEMGISFDGRTTDAALLRRIGAALEPR